jgi:hypothetical protein
VKKDDFEDDDDDDENSLEIVTLPLSAFDGVDMTIPEWKKERPQQQQ